MLIDLQFIVYNIFVPLFIYGIIKFHYDKWNQTKNLLETEMMKVGWRLISSSLLSSQFKNRDIHIDISYGISGVTTIVKGSYEVKLKDHGCFYYPNQVDVNIKFTTLTLDHYIIIHYIFRFLKMPNEISFEDKSICAFAFIVIPEKNSTKLNFKY